MANKISRRQFLTGALIIGLAWAPSPATWAASREEMRQFRLFLKTHPKIATELRNNPKLVNNKKYMSRRPDLEKFLKRHPAVKREILDHPRRVFAK